jgi:hypothetical protein
MIYRSESEINKIINLFKYNGFKDIHILLYKDHIINIINWLMSMNYKYTIEKKSENQIIGINISWER